MKEDTKNQLRKSLIQDYQAERRHYSSLPSEKVITKGSFTGKPATAKEQVEYCDKAIAALEDGAEPDDWNY